MKYIDDKLFGTAELLDGSDKSVDVWSAQVGDPIPGGTRRTHRHDTNLKRGHAAHPASLIFLKIHYLYVGDGDPGGIAEPVSLRTMFEIERRLVVELRIGGRSMLMAPAPTMGIGAEWDVQGQLWFLRDNKDPRSGHRVTPDEKMELWLHPQLALPIKQKIGRKLARRVGVRAQVQAWLEVAEATGT